MDAGASKARRQKWRLLALPAWALLLVAVLQIHKSEGLWGHAICGPWGCGPPVEALVSYHAFWGVLIVPIALVLGWQLPPKAARSLAWGLVVAGGLAMLGMLVWSSINWLITAREDLQQYVVQRSFFVLATTVDVPAAQILIAGLCCLTSSRWGARRILDDPPSPPHVAGQESVASR